jgi:hypothetical protein
MKNFMLSFLVLFATFAWPAVAQDQVGTCIGPGVCTPDGIHTEHTKSIECPQSLWNDGFYVRATMPFGVVPLAGEVGYDRKAQCDMLRRAVTGE